MDYAECRNLFLTSPVTILFLAKLLFLAQFHIYKSKMIKKKPVFSAFKYELLMYLKADRISAVSKNKLKLVDIKWKDWKKYISINIK